MCEYITTLEIIERKDVTEAIEAEIVVNWIRKWWILTWKKRVSVKVGRLGMTVKVMWWIFTDEGVRLLIFVRRRFSPNGPSLINFPSWFRRSGRSLVWERERNWIWFWDTGWLRGRWRCVQSDVTVRPSVIRRSSSLDNRQAKRRFSFVFDL